MKTKGNLSASGLAYTGPKTQTEDGLWHVSWKLEDLTQLMDIRVAYLREKFPTIEPLPSLDTYLAILQSGKSYDIKDRYEIIFTCGRTVIFHKDNVLWWSHLREDCDFSPLDNP